MTRASAAAIAPSLSVVAFVGAVALAGASVATPAAKSASAAKPAAGATLLPLSEADKTGSHQTGCTFSFDSGRHSYLQLIDHELMFRTRGRLNVCRIANADPFSEAKGTVATCRGASLKLRTHGRTKQYPSSDASSTAAQLWIDQGGVSRSLSGDWGVAC